MIRLESLFQLRRATALLAILTITAFSLCLTTSSRADDPKPLTAEQVAEGAILIAGNGFGRTVLDQIRRNGVERGRQTRIAADGRTEESRYELRFVRGDKPDKDKYRLDNKSP